MGEARTDRPSSDLDRLTVAQAAHALSISQDAVRKRISRGTIPHDRDDSGRVYVYLSPTETVHKTDQDTAQDDATKTVQDTYIRSLEDQIAFLRQELERKDRILLNLTERIPELEAPSDDRESPQTVEEEPERPEPRPDDPGAQEGALRPHQRGVWLAPVDKLPWWHYVLGLLLVLLASYITSYLLDSLHSIVAGLAILFLAAGTPPGLFGFWVGFRKRSARLRSEVIRFGVLVGVAIVIGTVVAIIMVTQMPFGQFALFWFAVMAATLFQGWLFYVSGALVGNAWQRRRTGRVSGTVPSSPMSGTRTEWTPRQQAILGFIGTVIAALISLVGVIFSAMASGS